MQEYKLAFLANVAANPQSSLSVQERALLETNRQLLSQATSIIILLGGKAGRLGECVVGTALLTGTLEALRWLKKEGTPIHLLIDADAADLFLPESYQQSYWSPISVQRCKQPIQDIRSIRSTLALSATEAERVVVLDLHGAHDGLPYLAIEDKTHSDACTSTDKQLPQAPEAPLAILGDLFRVGVRNYAQRGPERRYADYIEDLFALPHNALDRSAIQPNILLTDDERHYQQLMIDWHIDRAAFKVVCIFQSVVLAKCYEKWDEVMDLICQHFAQHIPQQKIEFLVLCGPDKDLPLGFTKPDIAEWLQDYTGIQHNAHVTIQSTQSLRDLAIIIQHAELALSNDTGPGHIAGALKIPTIVPYLPGNIYAKSIWASTPWHRGVTLEPNPYSYQQLEAAVIWGKTDIIDSIDPASIYREVEPYLPRGS
jgi:Glycosyltransferase family 9 (heptosyltransferase)